MLSVVFKLLNLVSFITGGLNLQTPLGPTVDLGYATGPGEPPYEVDLTYVKYQGKQDDKYTKTVVYLGLPYAEAPTGDKRFKAPVAVSEMGNSGTAVPVISYPLPCIQGSLNLLWDAGEHESEDCLKVNIYLPSGTKETAKLPVMFYIHGGGWLMGDPKDWPFEHWIEQSPNVIIVSVYYRLASFGFLASPDLPQGDLNAGFQDQIQALTWVKKHISKFGGDPAKVTIAGHSAGADAVNLHMASNKSKGLFSQAIAQSVSRRPIPTPKQQQALFQFYALHAGCGTGSVEQQMECLRKASINELVLAQRMAASAAPYHFYPVLDGKLITGYPTTMFKDDMFTHVPLLVGSTTHDTLSFDPNHDISKALKKYFPLLKESDIQEFFSHYPLADFGNSPILQFLAATGEPELKCAVHAMGGPSSKTMDTWTYQYNMPDPNISKLDPNLKKVITHGAENYMMFRGWTVLPDGRVTKIPKDLEGIEKNFAEELIAYWLSFVREGNPNTHKLSWSPTWTKYSTATPTRMVLQQPSSTVKPIPTSGSKMETTPDDKAFARCRFVISKAEVCQY